MNGLTLVKMVTLELEYYRFSILYLEHAIYQRTRRSRISMVQTDAYKYRSVGKQIKFVEAGTLADDNNYLGNQRVAVFI